MSYILNSSISIALSSFISEFIQNNSFSRDTKSNKQKKKLETCKYLNLINSVASKYQVIVDIVLFYKQKSY